MASVRTRMRLRQLFVIMGIACSVVPVFNLLTNVPSLRQAVQGAVDAAVITLLVGGYLLFLRDGALRPWFRRRGFITDLLLNSLILVALFLLGRATGQAIAHVDVSAFWLSFRDPHLMFALPFFVVLAFSIQFVRQMNRMIGANVLGYFMAGVYRQPQDEQRIFLFVDLEGSTRIAEQLGSARYFELLRRFADDVGAAALASAGQIYQYVGDEVVVTWPQATGVRHAQCVRCFFALRDEVARHAARYEREFGLVPRFQGGLHGGHVTAGEIGDLHQQIVYVGDILNTAARLQEHAKRSGFDLVISGSLLQQLDLPGDIAARACGELALRGKDAPVAAFSLTRLAPRAPG